MYDKKFDKNLNTSKKLEQVRKYLQINTFQGLADFFKMSVNDLNLVNKRCLTEFEEKLLDALSGNYGDLC